MPADPSTPTDDPVRGAPVPATDPTGGYFAPPPPSAPPPSTPPETTPPGATPPEAAAGAAAQRAPTRAGEPLPAVVPRRPPPGNGLGPVAAFCGLVGLGLGIVLPWFVLLVLVTAGGGLVMGAATFRQSVVTGAPGRWFGLVGAVSGLVGLVLMFVGLADTREAMRESARGLGGIFGTLESANAAGEVRGITFPGTGRAHVVLDDVDLDVELVGCGFADPAPGIALGGHGSVPEPRYVSVAFSSSTLGGRSEALAVDVGTTTWVLRPAGDQPLFVLEGRTLTASGEFWPLGGGEQVAGTVTATCTH